MSNVFLTEKKSVKFITIVVVLSLQCSKHSSHYTEQGYIPYLSNIFTQTSVFILNLCKYLYCTSSCIYFCISKVLVCRITECVMYHTVCLHCEEKRKSILVGDIL